MNLADIHSKKTERVERKIILQKGQSKFFLGRLKEIGFKKVYGSRKVNSIYFDDIDMNSLRDNIDGNRNRNKIRIRYYGDSLSRCNIEIKQKRGLLGYKTKIHLEGTFKNISNLIFKAQRKITLLTDKKFLPVSHINYQREYLKNENFRATVDTHVCSNRISSSGVKLYSSKGEYEVIEFKYLPIYDEKFRQIFNFLSPFYVRATKSSKYSNSMMF